MVEWDLIWMSAVVFTPTVFALFLIFIPRGKEEAMRWWSLFGTALTLGLSLCMLISFYSNVIDQNSIRAGSEQNRYRATLDYRLMEHESGRQSDPQDSRDWLTRYPWIPHFHIDYYMGADGISVPLVIL